MAFDRVKILFLLFCATILVGVNAFASTKASSSNIHIGVFDSKQDAQNFYETLSSKIKNNIHENQLWLDVYKGKEGLLEHYINVSGLSHSNAKGICQSVTSSSVQCTTSGIEPLFSASEPRKTISAIDKKTAADLPLILQPLGLRLQTASLEADDMNLAFSDQTLPDQTLPDQTFIGAYPDFQVRETYSDNFSLDPQILDTPQAMAAKAAYDTARNTFISALQNIGAGVNAGKGAEAAHENLLALGRGVFEAAGSAYLSGFLEEELGQAEVLSSAAGSGTAFIHHVKINLKDSARNTVETLISETISAAASDQELQADFIKEQTDALMLSGARALIDAGLAGARRSDLYALRNLELEYNLNSFEESYISVLMTQPIYQSMNARHNIFFQGGGILNERSVDIDDDKARHTLNLGAAYRYLTVDEKYLLGGNIFFDHQWPYDHSRMSIGMDARANNLNFAANYYIPLTDYRNSRTDSNGIEYEERALKGYDLELGYTLPFLPDLSIFGKGYQYFRNTDDNLRGLELSAEYNIRDNFTLRGAVIEENGGRDGVEVALQYSIPLYDVDKPNLVLAAMEPAAGESSMRSKIFKKVRRENRIRVEERAKTTGVAIITAQFNALSAGLPFDVGGVATGALVNLPFNTAITVPNGDFGIINFSNGAIANISASGAGDVILEFNNTTLTVTATNGGFVQFISGNGGGISVVNVPGGTVNLLGTDIDVTDDGVTTTVQVRAGMIEVVPNVGVAVLNGNQADVVSLTIATGATSLLVNLVLEARQEAAFTNLDLINPDPPGTEKSAPFINAAPQFITGPQFVGNNADLRLTFTQAVTVTGAPQITGLIDANARNFIYNAGASTPTQLVFRHVYIAADVGAANITAQALDLNGGAIISTANGLNAVTAFTDTVIAITDLTAPMLTSSTPVDNDAAFNGGANIVLNFDENVQAGAGNITITDTTDGSDTRVIPIGDAQVLIVGSAITINPTGVLDLITDYDITIPSGVIEDLAGNAFAGIASGGLNFTTLNDVTPPTLASSTPADNAVNAALNDNIVLTFDEAVNKGTGNIEIRRTANNALLETIDVTTALVTGGGTTTITVNPANDYPSATDVYVLIDAGAFEDLFGNDYAGIAVATTLNFRGFAPLDIAGLQFWLDADDLDGDYVPEVLGEAGVIGGQAAVWEDKSGNNNDATQGNSGRRPVMGTRTLNGMNVLDFDGTADFMQGTALGLTQYTKFTVVLRDNSASRQNTISHVTGGDDAIYGASTPKATVYHLGIFITSGSNLNVGQAYVIGGTSDTSGNAELFFNGVSEGTGTRAVPSGAKSYQIGSHNSASLADGTFAEVVVFNRVLTPAEYAQVNAYLTAKWAVP